MKTLIRSQEGQVMKRIVSCRLPIDLIEELNCIADQEGFSRSQLMRQMLRAYVEYLRNDDQLHGQEEEK
jgi:metal-responsive CopG/Arc/MetJ family transcriptional regulator